MGMAPLGARMSGLDSSCQDLLFLMSRDRWRNMEADRPRGDGDGDESLGSVRFADGLDVIEEGDKSSLNIQSLKTGKRVGKNVQALYQFAWRDFIVSDHVFINVCIQCGSTKC